MNAFSNLLLLLIYIRKINWLKLILFEAWASHKINIDKY